MTQSTLWDRLKPEHKKTLNTYLTGPRYQVSNLERGTAEELVEALKKETHIIWLTYIHVKWLHELLIHYNSTIIDYFDIKNLFVEVETGE